MTFAAKGTPPRQEDGPLELSSLGGVDFQPNSPIQAQVTNPHAVREAKLELLRDAIFENLGAVSLFAETAKLSIEARDDAGMRHAVKMGAQHYRAAVVTANELAALNEPPS